MVHRGIIGESPIAGGKRLPVFLAIVLISTTFGLGWISATGAPFKEATPAPDSPGAWDVYVTASAITWQLFNSPSPYDDYQKGHNVMFVYTTAGDAGEGSWWWQAREEGAKASVRSMIGSAPESAGVVNICHGAPGPVCHDLWQWTYGRSTSFFMRLPDGNRNGGGFASTGFVSLARLRDGGTPSLTAVDGSATYTGWSDLSLTLGAIVAAYAPYDSTTSVKGHDFDRERQTSQSGSTCPGCPDHADDLATADLTYAITIGASAPWSRVFFIDYPTGYADPRYPVNLAPDAYAIKQRIFLAYSDKLKELTGLDEYGSVPDFWENFFWRLYSRDIPVGPPPPPDPPRVWDAYVIAHPDDWQLFDSPSPYDDYQKGHSVLFIFATAGDAGEPSSWWQAREEGAKASTRSMAGAGAPESSGWVQACYSVPSPVCHDIWRWTYGHSMSFFLRVPDGNYNGGGFGSTGFVSLAKLRDGLVPRLAAVDGSTSYEGWEDFYLTLRAIMVAYTPYDATTSIKAHDFDRDRQTSGAGSTCAGCANHSDHMAIADAVYAIAMGASAPWSRVFFIDYPTGYADPRYPVNLGADTYAIKKQIFMAYSDKVKALTGADEYAGDADFWENFFWRLYSRDVPAPPPPPVPGSPQVWDAYVTASAITWQLFSSPSPYQDYQDGHDVMFVYTTAGDGGEASSWWQAREEGAKASVREMVGVGATESSASVQICHGAPAPVCHNISRWTYGRSVSFFMRLPDGNSGGFGFPRTGNTGLAQLRDGLVANLTAVDGSTKYEGWSDLYLTLKAILVAYTPYDSTTRIVAPDFDRTRQTTQAASCSGCADHSDDLATADAVYAITIGMSSPWSRAWVIGYPILYADARYPVNVDAVAHDIKKRIYMAYSDTVMALTGFDEYNGARDLWESAFWRYYVRSA